MTYEEWVEFTFVIEDEFETLLQFDMVKLEDANEQLLSEINKSEKVIYSKVKH